MIESKEKRTKKFIIIKLKFQTREYKKAFLKLALIPNYLARVIPEENIKVKSLNNLSLKINTINFLRKIPLTKKLYNNKI